MSRAYPTPEELASLRDSAHLQGVQPILVQMFTQLEKELDNRMQQAQMDGKLTPEIAHAAWLEKLVIKRLWQKIDQKIRIGAQ